MDNDGKLLTARERHSTFEHNGRKLDVEYYVENVLGKGKDERWRVYLDSYPYGTFASVIRRPFSYGYEAGLYELAFCKGNEILSIFEKDWGDSVLGYLDEDQVIYWINVLMNRMGLD